MRKSIIAVVSLGLSMFMLGTGVAGAKTVPSTPESYVPKKLNGKTVVIDNRSTVPPTNPTCQIPPEGIV
jgi:hypothetical protein